MLLDTGMKMRQAEIRDMYLLELNDGGKVGGADNGV